MTNQQKFARFNETTRNRVSVVCCKCGSCNLDQNSLTELRCYDCGNTLPWDGRKFGILREFNAKQDLINAICQ